MSTKPPSIDLDMDPREKRNRIMSLCCGLNAEVMIQTQRLAKAREKEKREIESYIISLQAGVKTCMDEAVAVGMRMSAVKYARKRSKADKSKTERSEPQKSEAEWDIVPGKGADKEAYTLVNVVEREDADAEDKKTQL